MRGEMTEFMNGYPTLAIIIASLFILGLIIYIIHVKPLVQEQKNGGKQNETNKKTNR